ncbi:nuclear transport factor 2 family protein [Streptomyces sp. LP11]|uniref:Nuclear transport factor 2 family protein n=1 Tax=Streptomyces pyxinicus TaxID=2970331 RepID=A0ABT2B4N7_9ACTN|nr:nuclear transport factor 2 family protein [Streptomyces sp. LP11]MCS0603484.1 nuclear transport factor 2 family protein [Streptomyces sp. LP11]
MPEHSTPAAVAHRFLQAFGDRDWEALGELFAKDIAWSMPGSGTISGNAHGPEEALRRAREIAAGGVRTELLHVLVGARGVALSLRNTAEAPDGRLLDEHLATVLGIRHGLIATIDSYLSDVDGMSAFFVR